LAVLGVKDVESATLVSGEERRDELQALREDVVEDVTGKGLEVAVAEDLAGSGSAEERAERVPILCVDAEAGGGQQDAVEPFSLVLREPKVAENACVRRGERAL
jgi:hypothetical protein